MSRPIASSSTHQRAGDLINERETHRVHFEARCGSRQLLSNCYGNSIASEQAINRLSHRVPFSLSTGNYQGIGKSMNRWQQERAVMDELLRMEEAGEVRQNADGKWEQTELGREVALQQLKEDYGIWAPLIRLLYRVKAWCL
jgi:hypothetical protein